MQPRHSVILTQLVALVAAVVVGGTLAWVFHVRSVGGQLDAQATAAPGLLSSTDNPRHAIALLSRPGIEVHFLPPLGMMPPPPGPMPYMFPARHAYWFAHAIAAIAHIPPRLVLMGSRRILLVASPEALAQWFLADVAICACAIAILLFHAVRAYGVATEAVARTLAEREAAAAEYQRFLADAGHELRTPLTVIGGYIDVLRRGAIEEPHIARQILATMSLEKEHMRGLIDRLMRLARLDSEELPRPEKIDIAEFLRVQCDAARRLDDRRVIDYRVEGVESIEADRSELGEAMWNIIENALKYAPDAPIHVSAARSNGHVVLAVRDEGPGMPESERLHAFERFYRGDQRGEITGSGLGLAIAKRAVERAGGDIAIDSAPGHGTEVTITLPS